MRLLLLVLATAFAPGLTFAAPSVTVLWKVHFTTPSGPGILSVPSAAYLNTLHGCGFTANLAAQPDLLPVSVLRCPGVLDLSESAHLRERMSQRLLLVEKEGHRSVRGISIEEIRSGLASIDFGLAHYGVFLSQLDGAGTARYMGLNVASMKLVILNKPFWDQLTGSERGDPFLLHETLGALNYDDTDYAISNVLYSFSQTPHHPGDGDEASSNVPARLPPADEGGASVVGRGGDDNQQTFKASLLKAAEKPPRVTGVDPRYAPTEAELKKVITETPVTVAPREFFADGKLCDDPQTGAVSEFYCGGFVLKGVGGKPFLLITQAWGEFPDAEKPKLLGKVFTNIVTELIKAKLP